MFCICLIFRLNNASSCLQVIVIPVHSKSLVAFLEPGSFFKFFFVSFRFFYLVFLFSRFLFCFALLFVSSCFNFYFIMFSLKIMAITK